MRDGEEATKDVASDEIGLITWGALEHESYHSVRHILSQGAGFCTQQSVISY